MNLCIDQGNSRTKVALMTDEGHIVKNFIYKSFRSSDVERLFALYPITDSIISSVINIEPAIVNALHRLSKHFILFDHNTPVPIVNAYDTPETLGQDRLAAAVGAVALCPDENLLIIDAGSAVTYDFVSAQGRYEGGNIAPGIKMRFVMLHRMTKKLPQVDLDENELIPLLVQIRTMPLLQVWCVAWCMRSRGICVHWGNERSIFKPSLRGGMPHTYSTISGPQMPQNTPSGMRNILSSSD